MCIEYTVYTWRHKCIRIRCHDPGGGVKEHWENRKHKRRGATRSGLATINGRLYAEYQKTDWQDRKKKKGKQTRKKKNKRITFFWNRNKKGRKERWEPDKFVGIQTKFHIEAVGIACHLKKNCDDVRLVRSSGNIIIFGGWGSDLGLFFIFWWGYLCHIFGGCALSKRPVSYG